jgi:hypothetical protein
MREIDYSKLPEHMRGGARRYVEQGVQPGDFLCEVLANRLVHAARAADWINAGALHDWAAWLWVNAPRECWGNPDIVRAWCEQGGLRGLSFQGADDSPGKLDHDGQSPGAP